MIVRPSHLSRLRRVVPIALLAFAATSGGAVARTPHGGDFDRITADMQAAVARHDRRFYHAFENQLRELIDRALSD
jgi:hypothetical protein